MNPGCRCTDYARSAKNAPTPTLPPTLRGTPRRSSTGRFYHRRQPLRRGARAVCSLLVQRLWIQSAARPSDVVSTQGSDGHWVRLCSPPTATPCGVLGHATSLVIGCRSFADEVVHDHGIPLEHLTVVPGAPTVNGGHLRNPLVRCVAQPDTLPRSGRPAEGGIRLCARPTAIARC